MASRKEVVGIVYSQVSELSGVEVGSEAYSFCNSYTKRLIDVPVMRRRSWLTRPIMVFRANVVLARRQQ
jgi:hypothetical protein